ncbi:hypothetical protein DH2020_000979 [Rehmannia glutinosa]|uniref:ABC transporter domain-containing protein n=1 Tax=Rehmannia glutinosa TaxID=99300 RepID=A0ABR0XYH6_REHGL
MSELHFLYPLSSSSDCGLNASYDGVAIYLQQQKPLPPFHEARSRLILEEARKQEQVEAAASQTATSLVTTAWSPGAHLKTGPPRNGGEAYLVWEDLMVVLPNFGHGPTKKLLHGLHGYAEPGRIMAIMGPSGSGKSTLLDALAGRLSRNIVMTGNILLNGKKQRLDYGVVAYVTQEDVLLGTLTVRETLTYSAHLRLPSSMTKEEVKDVVEGTITEMGLQDCADRQIGNWQLRGISGGEKKRLSIALEILIRPRLLFLDEPTSGLDSAAAFFVIQAIKNLARDGRTVISSIHQPSSEVFALFDDLYLLSGGETVYFGEAKMAIKFFAEAGFPCPSRRNPSDHFLRCINSDFDIVTATLKGSQRLRETEKASDPLMNLATEDIKSILVEKYKQSAYARKARLRLREISIFRELEIESIKGSQAKWWKQLSILTQRSFVNMSRDVGYYWSRIVIYTMVALSVGTLFYDVGTSYTAILARELVVFYRERLNGYYGVAVFILSNFLSSFPFLVAVSVITGTITFYMPLVPNFLMGIIAGAGVLGIMMMTAGFFRLLPDLPKPVWRYPISYIGYGAWSLQGGYKNDLLGLVFDPLFDVYALIIVYRLVFFIILKLKDRAALFLHSLYTKRTLYRLNKQPSFQRLTRLLLLLQDSCFHMVILMVEDVLKEKEVGGAYKNDMIGVVFDPLIPGDPKIKGEHVIKDMFRISLDHSKWWDLFALFALIVCYRLVFFIILKVKERTAPFFQSLYAKRALYQFKKRPSFKRKPSFSSKRFNNLHPLSSQEGLNSPIP